MNEIEKALSDWSKPPFPEEAQREAEKLLAEHRAGNSPDEIEYYTNELRFGTGGLRGVIGYGAGRMNLWTVGRAAQGFCNYLLKNYESPAIVIAYDSRRMSREFSQVVAGVAAHLKMRVHLFDAPAPTPALSFAIRELKAQGGAVITASHNPPEYNGFKVYLEDGAQLLGSAQVEVEKEIENLSDWNRIKFASPEDENYRELVSMVGGEMLESYIQRVRQVPFVTPADNPPKKELKIVYSPLHGTGGVWMTRLLERCGFTVYPVEEQFKGDGEFPTVKYPNPEEPEAMELARRRACELDADIFLATDPDADRLGAGLRVSPGQYELINGNQIGSLMCAYLCENLNSIKPDSSRRYHVLKTIVTSELQTRIAHKHGVSILNVLTGFKYIAEQLRLMEEGSADFNYESGRESYLFGGEESFGYLPVDFVRDKDSLSSALLLCEILANKGDILGYLDDVYLRYGLYLENLKSVTLKGSAGQSKIKSTIEKLRTDSLTGKKLGDRSISQVLDYRAQTVNGSESFPAELSHLPPADVLQFRLEPEGVVTIRPSGTEPKVKLYASLRSTRPLQNRNELKSARDELAAELDVIADDFFELAGL